MRNLNYAGIAIILSCIAWITIKGKVAGPPKRNVASVSLTAAVERQLNYIESNIINLAEAMPDDKYYFTPENLNIPGSTFKGVRTFAGQIKHLATDNYDMWCTITGDSLPPGIKDVNGPDNIKSKEDILKYLKGSFAEGHKAIATLTSDNAMDMLDFRGGKMPRLDLVFYGLTHSNDHYGQMVVYFRMCGLTPGMSMNKK